MTALAGRPTVIDTAGLTNRAVSPAQRTLWAAVEFAFEEAELRGVGLTAVHAWRYPLIESPSAM